MTVSELIERLKQEPFDARVTVSGYEWGVQFVREVVSARPLALDVHEDTYGGAHDYDDPDAVVHIAAVHLR
jgi:hypothetical protein